MLSSRLLLGLKGLSFAGYGPVMSIHIHMGDCTTQEDIHILTMLYYCYSITAILAFYIDLFQKIKGNGPRTVEQRCTS